MNATLLMAGAAVGQLAAPAQAAAAQATHAAGACPTCGHVPASSPLMWLVIGFVGQSIFTARFLAQWIASEKKRDSVVPVIFWWLSMAGGLTLLAYAIHRADPVIIVGQSMGVFIYIRNLMLVGKARRRAERAREREQVAAQAGGGIPRPHHADSQAGARRQTPAN